MIRHLQRIAAVLALLAPVAAHSQQAILQAGPWAAGHAPMYVAPGLSQPVIQDSGSAGGGTLGAGLSEMLLTSRGTGNAPYANAGTGPYGTNFCNYDAPITNTNGGHYLCSGANSQGGGLIAYGAFGASAQLPLNIIVNGVSYPFPGSGLGNVTGPNPAVIGHIPLLGNIQGTLLTDSGFSLSNYLSTSVAASTYYPLTGGAVTGPVSSTPVSLTPGTSITPTFGSSNFFTVTLAANATINNPTGQAAGQSGCISLVQDSIGSRTVTWGSNWKWPGGTAPTLTTTGNAVDDVCFWVTSVGTIHGNIASNFQ